MSGTLFLHIGSHKTGSTAIQDYFYQHHEELAREGLHYPDLGQARAGHHELAWAGGLGPNRAANPEAFLEGCEHIQRLLQDGVDVVISSEDFEFAQELNRLQPLLGVPRIKVILYVRKQDEMLESVYGQHVAMYSLRYAGSIYQLSQKNNFTNRFNYLVVAQRWADAVGSDNLLIRPYGTSLVGQDSCADLLQVIGNERAQAHYAAQPPQRANLTQGAHALRLLAHLNRLTLSQQQHNSLLPILRAQRPPDSTARLLHREDAAAFYERFRYSNTLMFEQFSGLNSVPFDELATARDNTTWLVHEQVDTRELMDLVNVFITQPIHD